MTEQEQKAFTAMREALEQALRGMSAAIFGTDTYKVSSRGDFASKVEKQIHEALTAANAVSEQPRLSDSRITTFQLGNAVQPQAQDQICDAQRRALIEYGDARESKDPERIATAFVNALHTRSQATEPAGWKLVPVEPTQDMRIAGGDELMPYTTEHSVSAYEQANKSYRAMLAAAPEAP